MDLKDLANILSMRPMTPWEGPPLPYILNLYWPWAAFECPVCHKNVYKSKRENTAASHFYKHLIDGDITREEYEEYMAIYAPHWMI